MEISFREGLRGAMGKTGRWLRSLLIGKKEKKEKSSGNQPATLPNEEQSATIPVPVPAPKEKRRWSFRRSAGATKDMNSPDPVTATPTWGVSESGRDQKRHAMAVATATAAAADAALAAAQAAAVADVIRLRAAPKCRSSAIEEAAAIKIQSVFRSYLARKALCALKGLVKLQALVRGHLVRKQATATLRRIQALVTAQARARAQRIKMVGESQISQRQSIHRQSPQHSRFRQSFDTDRRGEENIKIVEMDVGEPKGSLKSRNSYSISQTDRKDPSLSLYCGGYRVPSIIVPYRQLSPALSALTDKTPRTCSGHFEDFSYNPSQNSPQYLSAASKPDSPKAPFTQDYIYSNSHDQQFCPNYMANTESSRAKARSQSAPKQRPESCERQPSRRRSTLEGRTIPRSLRMQRSSSHVGETTNGYLSPWSIKLDKSSVSLKDSECGSTSTIQTSRNYCRSLFAPEVCKF